MMRFDVEASEKLKRQLVAFRELPNEVRTRTRRVLRTVGDEVIAEQRAILSGPLPKGVAVAGKRTKTFRNGRKKWSRQINVYADADVKGGSRSTGLREAIKKGLKTRIVSGKTRQGVAVRTTNTSTPMSTGWNSRRFRHPVFGRNQFVYQAGQPYFYGPALAGRDRMLQRASEILDDVVGGV